MQMRNSMRIYFLCFFVVILACPCHCSDEVFLVSIVYGLMLITIVTFLPWPKVILHQEPWILPMFISAISQWCLCLSSQITSDLFQSELMHINKMLSFASNTRQLSTKWSTDNFKFQNTICGGFLSTSLCERILSWSRYESNVHLHISYI